MGFNRLVALVAAGISIGTYTAASIIVSRRAWMTRDECHLPCRDLGREVLRPAASKMHEPTYRPACRPLELQLVLHRPVARRNSRYSLWYRAKIQNVSCYDLDWVDKNGFIYSLDEFGLTSFHNEGLGFRIWGPDGREVPQGNFEKSSDYAYLYGSDNAEISRRQAADKYFDSGDLPSGASFETVASTLEPTRRVATASFDPRSGDSIHGFRPEAINPPPDAETPPPGFKVLDAFQLRQPGKYRIQATFEDDYVRASARFSRKVPNWLAFPARKLSRAGLPIFPPVEDRESRIFSVRAESAVAEFTVPP